MRETAGEDQAALHARIAELEAEVTRLRHAAEGDARTYAESEGDLFEMQASRALSGIAAAADRREIVAGWANLAESQAENRRFKQRQETSETQSTEISLALAELEAVYQVMPAGLAVLDGELRYVRVNETMARINGVPVAEHIGRTVREVVPEVAAYVEAIFCRVFETGEPAEQLEFEAPTPGSSGEPRVWLENATPLKDAEGRPRFVLVTVLDITERKRAEQALAKGEVYWRGIFERLHEGFVVGEVMRDEAGKGVDWRFIEMNAAWERLTGLSREAARGRTVSEAIPGIEQVWIDTWVRVVDTGKPANVVHWAQPLGRWYEAHAFRLEPERFAIVFLDMTERKQAETAVQESEERLRTLADNIPLLCWMAEPNGHVFWYNQRWHEYTGLFPKEIEGWGWQAVHDPAELPAVLVGWQRSIASGEPFEAVFPLRGADGTFRPFLTRAVPIRSETGQVTRWFGTNTEVKDIVDAREALARSRAELERLVEERTAALLREVEERRKAEEALRQGEKLAALGQLTGGIAHDFNNILQVVSSGATLLRYPRLTEERREAVLDGLSKAAESAKDLTGRLLAFARKQTLRPETFDVNARLEHMSELLRQTLGSRIVVETDFAADLWPAFADPSQLEVAVLNLAVNARDAMLPKGGTLIVQTCNTYLEATSERMAGEYVRLVVKDTGRGMPPSVLARVFEPFFTTKGPDRGTGLGLAQVHGFTKQSGGDITVQSTPGQGTTITLHLARATAAQMDAPAAPAKETAGAGLARTAGKTVLVVEDNPDVGSFTVGLLENLGYATRSAANAAEALALIERGEAVDAVFSDVVMPGEMNGVTLASELRMRFPHLAVVLATGYSEVLAQWNGRAAAEVLRKPYRLEEVAAALERAFVAVGAGTPEADGRERA